MATPSASQTTQHPDQEHWDVIVVGTGMGGSTTGHALAKKGHKVLFLEKGLWLFGDHDRGDGVLRGAKEPSGRLNAGYWPTQLHGRTSFGETRFHAPWGCGSGGGTSIYAAQQERFMPSDFEPRQHFPDPQGSTVPDKWPVSYEELAPFYAEAEQLFGVCGSQDPLHPDDGSSLKSPPDLDPRDQALFDTFADLGLNPYRSHMGCQFIEGCTGCTGGLCARRCRTGDAGLTCLLPAINDHGAKILTECEVLRVEADQSRATGVTFVHQGKTLTVKGKIIILAAGAYMSPVILLRSTSSEWPSGLANSSDMVGRNLMVHTSDYIAVKPKQKISGYSHGKTIAMNDFYIHDGVKLGSFQSVPLRINWRYVLHYLRTTHGRDPKWWRKFAKPFYRPAAVIGGYFYRNAKVFATVVEDLPYLHNRIVLDEKSENGMRFEYTYDDELKSRNKLLRKLIKGRLRSKLKTVVLTGENNLNYGHVCGTCRFSDDPKDGVLNKYNRTHDLEDLYIVDASFFPTSSGINPSLTIAANALRVSESIDKALHA